MIKNIFSSFPYLIQFLPRKLKSNKQFLQSIIDTNPEAFQYVDSILQNDADYILRFFNDDYLKIYELEKRFTFIYHKRKRHLLYEYCSLELKEDRIFLVNLLVKAEIEQNQKILFAIEDKFFHSLEFWVEFLKISQCRNWDLSFYKKALRKSFYLQDIKRKNIEGLTESLLDFFDLDWMIIQAEKEKLEQIIDKGSKEKIRKI